VIAAIRAIILPSDADSFGLTTYAGDKAVFADVRAELETLPFTSPRRLVVVENAESFVTASRALLEKYVSQPAVTGTLVLDVKSWPANTKLAKMLGDQAAIVCKALPIHRLGAWCGKWMSSRYGKQLSADAAALLVDFVGTETGQLDQEMQKLAIYVGEKKQVTAADVDQLVGKSRSENMWKIFDAIGAGEAGPALAILDGLFDHGEEPLRILGAFSMQLRRLAQVARLNQDGITLYRAMDQAGVPPFAQKGCEQQLRHLGKARTERLYNWLIQIDLGLKGSSQLPPRTLLERLVVQLARPN
jgi:DNA polymerase-3 subunit delta